MKFKLLLGQHCDSAILANEEARMAFEEFLRNIPGRILQVDIDPSKTVRQGFKDGDTVYKLGINVEEEYAFLEYYENSAQGQPTMMILARRKEKKLVIKGRKVNRTFYLGFAVREDGTIDRQQKSE